MIYHHAVIENFIYIAPDSSPPEQPGLLQVNRQLRNETVNIYYQENEFRWDIRDFNADKYIGWFGSSKHRRKAKCLWRNRGIRGWRNILRWLEAIYNRQAYGPNEVAVQGKGEGEGSRVVATLINMMTRMKNEEGLSWEQVKRHLEDMHKMFAAISSKWE
jgi:hypothetical protein